MTSSESRRQSVRSYHAKRKLAGERKLTFWIKPETDRVLTELASTVFGLSKDAVVNLAIAALADENGLEVVGEHP